MKWAAYIPVFFTFLLLTSTSIGQRTDIDSLLKAMLITKDTLRIDCLNRLSNAFVQAEERDSAEYYASQAYENSRKIYYIHGLAVSLMRKARIAKHFDDNFILSEKLAKESLGWFNKTPNKEDLYDVYFELEYSLRSQSRFDEMIGFAHKRYQLSKDNHDEAGMFDALAGIVSMYKDAGDYEKCYLYNQQYRQLALKTGNKKWLQISLFLLGELFMKIDDYNAALSNFQLAFQMDTPELERYRMNTDWDIWVKMEYAEIYSHLYQFDIAWHFFQMFKPAGRDDRYYRVYLVSVGELYMLEKKYNEALKYFTKGLYFHKKLNDVNEVQRALIFIAQCYQDLHRDTTALQYALEALQLAYKTKAKQITRDCYQILYTTYDRWHQQDSANLYFRRFSIMKDAVVNDKVKARLAVSNYEQKIELLRTEKQVQEQKLNNTIAERKYLLSGIVGILVLGIILFRNVLLKRKNETHLRKISENELRLQKLESEKTNAELHQQATELEMQALRAQMNPHFIFNCLNAINRFILMNDSQAAADYLTKFSRLIRMALNNSQKKFITLEEELETLELYLYMERLRFKNSFTYTINCNDSIDTSGICIPPLLLQPFAENAIWHGLVHREAGGELKINIEQQMDVLSCTITDNGVGRKKAAEFNSKSSEKKKSLGLQITKDRINLLNKGLHDQSHVEISDLQNEDGIPAGTRVSLKIKCRQNG